MSGSTIGGVVGAVVGAYFGNPQLGWMIGSAIGGYVDPEQIQGPRLQDARTQTSRDGIAIPFGWGTFPLAGNVIAQGPVVEVKKKERQGKGGPEVTTYTYTRTYAIGLCEGPIAGLLQVKRNGKVVYDARTDDAIAEEVNYDGSWAGEAINRYVSQVRAANAKWSNKATFYLGDETQMPDPALEAIFGAGNVPAHRGLAYFVVEDDDVTDLAGAIPQYEVVVAACGTSVTDAAGRGRVHSINVSANNLYSSANGMGGWMVTSLTESFGSTNERLFAGGGRMLQTAMNAGFVSYDHGGSWQPVTGLVNEQQTGFAYLDGLDVYLISYQNGSVISRSVAGVIFSDVAVEARSYFGMAAIGGRVVVGSTNGHVILSTDSGASFSAAFRVFPGFNNVEAVTTSASGFVAFQNVGSQVARSDNGAPGTWTLHDHPLVVYGGTFVGAATDSSRVVAVNSTGRSMFSVDGGKTWTQGGDLAGFTGNSGSFGASLANVNGRFVAVASNGVWTSEDGGLSWVSQSVASNLRDVVYVEVAAHQIPDSPGHYVDVNGVVSGPAGTIVSPCAGVPLSTIVASVCERRGIVADERDASQLTDLVTGFVVARETDAASIIQSLAPAYFFDPGEWDAKLRFIKRGGAAVGAINGDDLAERDGDAFERERVQEAELLRRVTVGYNDPAAAYALTTQKWERRAGTVQALGEASVELPLTMYADDAATVAARRGWVAWGEPEKQKFCLPYRLGKYTPTDIITYTDDDGLVHTIRLMDLQDDSGVRYVESSMNSAEAYGATATGVVPRPPSITEPSLRGPTLMAVMDLPLWRSGDADTLGLYVAGCGYLGGWQGAQVDVSTDGGVSYSEAAQVTVPATIGTTTTDLEAWASSEYPSVQTVTVTLPDAPESVSYEAMLRYNNRAAVQLDDGAWEILQYQTVVANGNGSYTLSGILRGRYATTPGAAGAGARFVLLDAAVQFVPVERHLLGETFKVRATTYGTSSDAAVASDFAFTAGASQAEWPVHGVTATRDGSDNVTVAWIGRARLGTETAPYHSANFAGYRVTYSDGETFDVGPSVTTHTRSSAPASQTITVRPLNAITGAGPASTGITA